MTGGAGEEAQRRRLFVYNAGFLTQRRVRRILHLAGWDLRLGRPRAEADWIGVWGQRPTAARGEAVAARTGAPILRIEDAPLRSLFPGRAQRDGPLGLCLDRSGVHFDPARPSDLERMLAEHPLDDTALLDRARECAQRLKAAHLTKYAAVDPDLPPPEAPYVLVFDQVRADASVTASRANVATFREMLVAARLEHPGIPVVIKSHPETVAGVRPGHFEAGDLGANVTILSDPISPWTLFEGAVGVYTISSLAGFEAIFAGHRPRVFGQPFYAGWGLTDDESPVARRSRKLTRAQLFAAAMILYPVWYDPFRDRLCPLETAIDVLEAEARAWREDRHGYVAAGIRLWKRNRVQRFFGGTRPVVFEDRPARAVPRAERDGRRLAIWASRETSGIAPPGLVRIEDGFVRSRGLGAKLVPALSLVADDRGIYYDPRRESRLERLIATSGDLPAGEVRRAERLIARLIAAGLSKYNLAGGALPALPPGRRILVVGQVEDDASVRLGCGEVARNRDLLARARAAAPDAAILYKPHPDVEAGLRDGALAPGEVAGLADLVLDDVDAAAAIDAADEVWTMTSLLGFEALIRGRPVTCLGAPFYAGWGLTTDLGPAVGRRKVQVSLAGLVHATLIAYPRYIDPRTGRPCPVEIVVERLAAGEGAAPGAGLRLLSTMQNVTAGYAHLWR